MNLSRFLAIALGLNLVLVQPMAYGQEIIAPGSPEVYQASELYDQLQNANVVYLGETHDSAADHQAQQQIVQALYDRKPQLAIGLEMVQRPYQPVLDRYLAGDITLDELRRLSDYDQRWGFPWEYYAPILQFAQAHGLPVVALNTPTEVTRQVARAGLESLTPEQFEWIPPLDEISTENDAYRQMIQPIYEEIHQGRTGSGASFEYFMQAQVLWDETMAEAIAQFVQANPDRLLIVLVGQGHLVYDYGIPDRVERRLQTMADFSQQTLLLNPLDDLQSESDAAIADWFWLSEPEAR
jgi:uncharacterized iron-regulated protein